ncbi:MAG: hypothetical protein ACO1OB_06890 [Archangium sp.]
MFLLLFAVSGIVIVLVVLALARQRTPPRPDGPILERARWSLRLRIDAPLIITCEVELPSEVWLATKRLTLIITNDDGREWRNTFDALSHPVELSVSPAFDRTPPAPHLSKEMLSTLQTVGCGTTSFDALVEHFELPAGRYRARAKLDDLESNELLINITGR